MGVFDWKYTAADLADWFDEQDDKHWREHDEWLIQSQRLGNASPVWVFASWASDRISTAQQRAQSSLAGGIIDVLRLGNDLDFSSAWGTAKGIFLNLTRLATVAGPIAEGLGVGARYAGLLATSKLERIEGAAGPCVYVSVNNLLSFLKGRKLQLFGVVEDIVEVTGKNAGTFHEALLATPKVQAALSKLGVTWKQLKGLKSIDDVLRAARSADGPVTFGIKWMMGTKEAGHALTVVKDAGGGIRILDYAEKGDGIFKGFGSLAEMMKARPQWGEGFAKATLVTENPVLEYSGRYLRLLTFGDGTSSFGLPVAMGMKWLGGGGTGDKVFDMLRSVWRYVKTQNPVAFPPPQEPSVPPDIPEEIKSVPTAPDQSGKRLGVSPLPPEAARAPRIDWLTGVQYRLKYLGYYTGHVNGVNDPRTKEAVLAFQKSWFDDKRQWDGIPGPVTQGALYAAVGW